LKEIEEYINPEGVGGEVELNPLTDRIQYLENSVEKLKSATLNVSGITNTKIRKDRRMKLYIKLDKETSEDFEKVSAVFKSANVVKGDNEVAEILLCEGLNVTIDRFNKELEALRGQLEALPGEEPSTSDEESNPEVKEEV